ncbi:MAG: serine protease [bacterium]
MPTLVDCVTQARNSVCAIMRVIKKRRKKGKKRKQSVDQYKLAFVGTAWCVVADRFLITAHHILNNGTIRDSQDTFYAFTVPDNGPQAHHYPITGFPVEDRNNDIAVLEVGTPATAGQRIPAVPITFSRPPDGMSVFTIGFPAPIISEARIDKNGQYAGGQFFLKGNVNEGIVSAQYDFAGCWLYEFNVGWHHGESGGPVFTLCPVAAFAIMQHYRNIQTPLGIVAGPHKGRSLAIIQTQLLNLGIKPV